MIETATKVPERENIFRITLKASSIVSPSQAQVLNESTLGKRIHSPSTVKSNTKKQSRSQLDYGKCSGEKEKEVDVGATSIYVRPTEKLFEKLQMDKDEAQREMTMKEHELL